MLVTFFMFLFYKDANTKLVKTEIDNIALTANQQRETINAAIKSHATNLGSMAKTIVILGDNETALVEYLRNLEKISILIMLFTLITTVLPPYQA